MKTIKLTTLICIEIIALIAALSFIYFIATGISTSVLMGVFGCTTYYDGLFTPPGVTCNYAQDLVQKYVILSFPLPTAALLTLLIFDWWFISFPLLLAVSLIFASIIQKRNTHNKFPVLVGLLWRHRKHRKFKIAAILTVACLFAIPMLLNFLFWR